MQYQAKQHGRPNGIGSLFHFDSRYIYAKVCVISSYDFQAFQVDESWFIIWPDMMVSRFKIGVPFEVPVDGYISPEANCTAQLRLVEAGPWHCGCWRLHRVSNLESQYLIICLKTSLNVVQAEFSILCPLVVSLKNWGPNSKKLI